MLVSCISVSFPFSAGIRHCNRVISGTAWSTGAASADCSGGASARSQVISRSENPQARSLGFRDVARIFLWGALFSTKSYPQNTGRQRLWLFHCQNKTNKAVRYGNILIFCSHYYRSKAIGRAELGRWIFQPGYLRICFQSCAKQRLYRHSN